MVAWHYPRSSTFCSKRNNCKQTDLSWRKDLSKRVSSRAEADACGQLHIVWDFVKDQSNILVNFDACSSWIEEFPVGNRTSETANVYFFQISARFETPKTLVSDNVPEFVIGDLKQ